MPIEVESADGLGLTMIKPYLACIASKRPAEITPLQPPQILIDVLHFVLWEIDRTLAGFTKA